MQSLHYMTLLEELRATLLANASSGSQSALIGAEIKEATSHIGEPNLWSSIAPDSLTTESGACRTEGK